MVNGPKTPKPRVSRHPTDLKGFSLSDEEKDFLARRAMAPGATLKGVANAYNLNESTIKKYVKAVREGRTMPGKAGRPQLLTPVSKVQLSKLFDERSYNMTTSEWHSIVDAKVVEQKIANNKPIGDFVTVSRRTLGRFEKEDAISRTNAEETTNAREEACADIRNAVTFAAMNMHMIPDTPSHCIMNLDATQFEVGNTNEEKVKCVYKTPPPDGGPFKVSKQEDTDSGLHYYIKYYLLITAGGMHASPVFLIADSELGVEDMYVYKVKGLGISASFASNDGILVICQTRGGNATFYKWLNTHYIIPSCNHPTFIAKEAAVRATQAAAVQKKSDMKKLIVRLPAGRKKNV